MRAFLSSVNSLVLAFSLVLFSCGEKQPETPVEPAPEQVYTLTLLDTLTCDLGNDRAFLELPSKETTTDQLDHFLDCNCKGKEKDELYQQMVTNYHDTRSRLALPNDDVVELVTYRNTGSANNKGFCADSLYHWAYKGFKQTKLLVNADASPTSRAQMINDRKNVIIGFGRTGGVTFRKYDSALNVVAECKLDFDEFGSVVQLEQKGDKYYALVQAYNANNQNTFIVLLDKDLKETQHGQIKEFAGEQMVQVKDRFIVYGAETQEGLFLSLVITDFRDHRIDLVTDKLHSANLFGTASETENHFIVDGRFLIDRYDPEEPVVEIKYAVDQKQLCPVLFKKDKFSFYVLLKTHVQEKEVWFKYLLELKKD